MRNKIILFLSTINFLFSSSEETWFTAWLWPDTGLFFWSVITFLIVFIILRWKAWGPIMQALDEREAQIQDSLNKAEKIVKDQEKSAQDNEAILKKARDEAQNIISQAKEAGDQLKIKLEKDGQDKYEELLVNATDQIGAEKQKALNDIKKTVIEIALNASEKIVKRNLNDEDNKKIIEETVSSFQHKN